MLCIGRLFALLALIVSGLVLIPATSQAVDGDGGLFVPLTPARLLNAGTWTGGTGGIAAGGTRTVPVLGVAGIPSSGVSAVVVDITAHSTSTTGSSYLTAWPAGTPKPAVASLYFTNENAPRTNTAVVEVGPTGAISVFNYAGATNVTVDLQGYFTDGSGQAGGGFTVTDPIRIANSLGFAEGVNIPQQKLGVGQSLDITAAGIGDIASDASAVFANVEVRNASALGSLWIGPGGGTQTWPQSMEYADNGPNNSARAVKLNSQGQMRIKNLTGAPVDIKVDVQGYFVDGSIEQAGTFTAMSPANAYSTGIAGNLLQGGETRTVSVGGQAGLPGDGSMGAALLTVSVKNWTASGAVSAFGTDLAAAPEATNVSFVTGQGEPTNGMSSTAAVRVSADGKLKLYNSSPQPVAVTLTAQGWFTRTNTLLDLTGAYTATTATLLDTPATSPLASGESREIVIGGVAGMPLYGVGAARINVTASGAGAPGELQVMTTGHPNSLTTLNSFGVVAPSVVTGALVRPGSLGKVTVKNTSSTPVDVQVSLTGWYAAQRAVTSSQEAAFIAAVDRFGVPEDYARQAVYLASIAEQMPTAVITQEEEDPLASTPPLLTNDPEVTTTDVPAPADAYVTTIPGSETDSDTDVLYRAINGTCASGYRLYAHSESHLVKNWMGRNMYQISSKKRWCTSKSLKRIGSAWTSGLSVRIYTPFRTILTYETKPELNEGSYLRCVVGKTRSCHFSARVVEVTTSSVPAMIGLSTVQWGSGYNVRWDGSAVSWTNAES